MSDAPKLLTGKRCLVTGGSRGLGRALVLAFAEHGARVAFTYRARTDEAQQTLRLLAERGHADVPSFMGDVAQSSHANEVVDALGERWGGVDVLVNNAAKVQIVPMALLEDADWDLTFATNVRGAYVFTRAALKWMLRERHGHILNIGTFGADRVVELPVHYAASKAALHGFSTSLAKEVGRYGVAVNYLAPGLLDTGVGLRLPPHRIKAYVEQCALGRTASAAEIADFAAWLVSDENSFMTGAKLVVSGGL